MFFKPRYHLSDTSPKVVSFFLQQYVEVMKNAKDGRDKRMKKYLYAVVVGLGVPRDVLPAVEIEAEPEPELAPEDNRLPIIHRRKYYGE